MPHIASDREGEARRTLDGMGGTGSPEWLIREDAGQQVLLALYLRQVLGIRSPDELPHLRDSRLLVGRALLHAAPMLLHERVTSRVAKALDRGVPIIGLRTSTHAFNGLKGQYAAFNNFGKDVLGERWGCSRDCRSG